MSDYIYGSSLRQAKSKANYLFEGDFRRRPNQNLSGASRSVARVELLQQAVEQRQNREDVRRKEASSVKIQSIWRGHRCRRRAAVEMRKSFDDIVRKLSLNAASSSVTNQTFESIIREFLLFYHTKLDQQRFDRLIELLLSDTKFMLEAKAREPRAWLFRIAKLLVMCLKSISDDHCKRHDEFLEYFTRQPDILLEDSEASFVWKAMIRGGFFAVIRDLAIRFDKSRMQQNLSSNLDNPFSRSLLELMRRPLNTQPDLYRTNPANKESISLPVCSFYDEFLCGPLDSSIEQFYLPQLIQMSPIQLQPQQIIKAFGTSHEFVRSHLGIEEANLSSSSVGAIQRPVTSREYKPKEILWLCYAFIKTLYSRIDQLDDKDKLNYLIIVSTLISPAESANEQNIMFDTSSDEADENVYDQYQDRARRYFRYFGTDHDSVMKIISLINDEAHVKSMKSIIFHREHPERIQEAIVKICNIMLIDDQLPITSDYLLLYNVAFSRAFLRSLWKSIVASPNTIFGPSTSVCARIVKGTNVSSDSWKVFLPRLKLFCSLCSYILPTLDDKEFYTEDKDKDFEERQESTNSSGSDHLTSGHNYSSANAFHPDSGFFVDKEFIGISATLRDICVGLIEILHQSKRATHQQSVMSFGNSSFREETKILSSYQMRLSFQALVRLVRQLHARDSRKKFCPDDHWICPSVYIPPNKVLDLPELRILNSFINSDYFSDRQASNEIKTILILQEIPFVISFHDRVQIFHQLLRKERQIHQTDGYHYGLPGTAIQVQIRRNYIYEDAFEKLSVENEPNMKLPLKVSLVNAVGADEAGIDGGGLTKEFLAELLKTGFDPMRGLFKYTNDNFLYPNPSANVLFSNSPNEFKAHYLFLGRMLGKSMFEKIMVELPLAGFFLAKLLADKYSSDVDLHNLESLDPVLYKNLVYLKNYKGNVADLNLDFTISNNELGEHEVVELKAGGSKIPVTRENKIEYVHLVADYRLNKQIRRQCAAFKQGLAQLIELDWLRMFDSRELQVLISGAPTVIDVADWRRHTVYGDGYSDDCEVIDTFWRVVSNFDESQKRKLLKFATSCSLPPLLGFKDLVPQFAIAPAEEIRLPTASTCMNLLKLPKCQEFETMKMKLSYAIESNSGFELS